MRLPSARTPPAPTARTAGLALLLLLFSSSSRVASCSANPIDTRALAAAEDSGLRLLVRQASSSNLQTFQGDLGGKSAAAIVSSGNDERIFEVDGDTFVSGSVLLITLVRVAARGAGKLGTRLA